MTDFLCADQTRLCTALFGSDTAGNAVVSVKDVGGKTSAQSLTQNNLATFATLVTAINGLISGAANFNFIT